MPRTQWYKLKSLEIICTRLQSDITRNMYLESQQKSTDLALHINVEEGQYVLQALRIAIGEMSK